MHDLLICKTNKKTMEAKAHKVKLTIEAKNLQPGDVVSVDQMVSPTAGLVAQMTGILTNKRY